MRQYELTAIFPLEEEEGRKGREQFQAELAAQGVEIETVNELGDRDFAYEIDKRRRGRYVCYCVKLDGAKIKALDKMFKLNENLIRYLFVKIET